jgi:hypothetical protein
MHADSDADQQTWCRPDRRAHFRGERSDARVPRFHSSVDCEVSLVGSLLVFESGVAGSVGERHVGSCASSVVAAVRGEPVQSALSSSGATAPTMIPKRNTVPVDPERR